jgi:Zn finger protein HypA/HybF involved in hydrogenase expression
VSVTAYCSVCSRRMYLENHEVLTCPVCLSMVEPLAETDEHDIGEALPPDEAVG